MLVDRTQGRRFVEQIRNAGLDAITLADVWGRNQAQLVKDVEWISWAAGNGCVGLTADESIRYLAAERDAISACGLQVFCFPHNNLLVAEQVRRVVQHAAGMKRLAADEPGPWLAAIYAGELTVKWRPVG